MTVKCGLHMRLKKMAQKKKKQSEFEVNMIKNHHSYQWSLWEPFSVILVPPSVLQWDKVLEVKTNPSWARL